MTYYAYMDPENDVDLKSYKETLGELLGEWHENDTDEIARIMAEYLTGPADAYAGAKAFRMIRERAERIIERANDNRQTGPEE